MDYQGKMDTGEKKQKIQWDEETIAEHDKERGSRQKIDEAPTPFRYHSESDQSECESDAETLKKVDLEDAAAEAAAANSPKSSQPSKKKSLPTNPAGNPNTMVSDSWEAINAKLQYEKHLQDAGSALSGPSMTLGKPSINDSVQRSQFYQNSGSNSNTNLGSHPHSQTGSPRMGQVSMATGSKIQDLQSNFGEILNPAPAAFSPQFTKKNYRLSGGKHSISTAMSVSADDERDGDGAGAGAGGVNLHHKTTESEASRRKPLLSPEKHVFIKAFPEGEESGEAMGVSPSESLDHTHKEHGGGHHSSGDELPSGEKKQFLNKRAGHYNEFKVLQAMRAKLAAEEEEEDDEDT